jgi:hypothetical protein
MKLAELFQGKPLAQGGPARCEKVLSKKWVSVEIYRSMHIV